MGDFIMASVYFNSAVGLYSTKWHKTLIIMFVLVACFFVSFALYALYINIRGVASQQKSVYKLIC